MATSIIKPANRARNAYMREFLDLTPIKQFAIAAICSLLLCVAIMGHWVARTIEWGVAEATIVSSGSYIEHYIAPHLQELAASDIISQPNIEAINRALDRPAARLNTTEIKVWKQDGLIVYSTNQDIIGRSFPVSPSLRQAWSGTTAVEFDSPDHDGDPTRTGTETPLLEVYTPIRDARSGEVIAVLEFYEDAENLRNEIATVRGYTWIVVALITIGMISALFWIVLSGSKSTSRQQMALSRRISQLTTMLRQTELARSRAGSTPDSQPGQGPQSSPRVAVGLHDGPAQLIASALLRLDGLAVRPRDIANLNEIRGALSVALSEIQGLCISLEAPELPEMGLHEALDFVVRDHARRTMKDIDYHVSGRPSRHITEMIKSSLCQFVRECLSSTVGDGADANARVILHWRRRSITVTVQIDAEPASEAVPLPHRLGLMSAWDRVECLGGTVMIEADPGRGTRIRAFVPLMKGTAHDS